MNKSGMSVSQTLRSFSPKLFVRYPASVPLILIILTSVFFAGIEPSFLSPVNISNMWAFIPELGIIAIGMTILLSAGEFDLSVGSTFALTPVVSFMFAADLNFPVALSIIIGIASSAVVGVINGILVTKVGISSFLVTLGTMLAVRGFCLYLTDGFPQNAPANSADARKLFAGALHWSTGTIYSGVIWFLAALAVGHLLLHSTKFGNALLATGGNEASARARGIDTVRVKVVLFAVTACLAGIAGVVSSFRIGSASPIAGQGYELQTIAMAVIGGTSLFGGRGTIFGTLFGVILLMEIRNGIIIAGFAGLAFDMFVGVIILAAMSIQTTIEKRGRK